ncbi:MAG: DUF3300 domain-containing protein [Pseudomonadota bacterium]
MRHTTLTFLAAVSFAATPTIATAQTPVRDDAPQVIETLSADVLQDVVGPVALYPDDLLAVVLPASVYPLQIVQAARFLEQREGDESLVPDPEWDESVVALLNYPEVLQMMSDDLDWTYDLGTAVVNQQPDVISAIESFRDRAYNAGNLRTDERVVVAREDEAITITPVEREVVYVPYYEPERVVVVQPAPVIQYFPHPFPLYYYPYATFNGFHNPHFFGVTTAFQIGWTSRNLRFHLHNYASHPFFGRPYLRSFYYHHRFQPTFFRNRPRAFSREGYANSLNRGYRGDRWRPVGRQNVRSFQTTRRQAASIGRRTTDGVRTLKPRDTRTRSAASTTRRANTTFSPRNDNRRRVTRTTRTRSSVQGPQRDRTVTTTRSTTRVAGGPRRADGERAPARGTTSRTTTTTRAAPNRSQTRSSAVTRSTTQRSTTRRSTRQSAPTTSAPRSAAPRASSAGNRRDTSSRSSAPPRQSAPRQSTSRQSASRSNSRASARSGGSRSQRSSGSSRNRSSGGSRRARQ